LLTPLPTEASIWQDLWYTADQQGQNALQKGDAASAQLLFEDPEWQAGAAYKNGDYDAAAELYKQGKNADGYYNLGNSMARLGKLDGAIKAYDQALSIDPNMQDAIANRSLVEQLKQQQQSQNSEQQEQSENSESQDSQQQNSSEDSHSEENQQQSEQKQAEQDSTEQQNQSEAEQQQNQHQTEEDKESAEQELSEMQKSEQEKVEEQQQQELQQWLRRVPDDPGGLLRQKFRYQSQQRASEQRRPPPPNQQERW
jgi:Ca-activated chloride channel family protein